MQTYGGGTAATAALHNAFAAENANGEAFYALCAQGNAQACTQFTSSVGQGAAMALNSFNQQVEGLRGATNPDLSFLQTFPSGVAGASTLQPVTTPIPLQTSDVLMPYKSQLEIVLTLVNQISTLNNRVRLLQGLFESHPTFNPPELLDLVSYLDRLEDIYRADRNTLLTSLQHCLGATSTNVTSVCQSIIANQATNAFEYYGANGPGDNFFAQQNTLALQYTAQHLSQSVPQLPLDVLYIDELPSFATVGSPVAIAGEAAFVSFVDRPSPGTDGGIVVAPGVNILALEPDAPLSTNNVSTKVRNNPPSPSPFIYWQVLNIPPPTLTSLSGFVFTSVSCTPTFANPCAIDYSSPPDTFTHRQIENLFTAE